eukprot:TRINITY_DN66413_c1_g1_i1.p3 TRINITY_DN66413_c1_g1~~TRINITY_DN66413_c1_g1_i1.p3  ORF type:complete len:142 (+),score=22.84 TRINITY_DN66413_c1_g1_i1:1636-2061(+)
MNADCIKKLQTNKCTCCGDLRRCVAAAKAGPTTDSHDVHMLTNTVHNVVARLLLVNITVTTTVTHKLLRGVCLEQRQQHQAHQEVMMTMMMTTVAMTGTTRTTIGVVITSIRSSPIPFGATVIENLLGPQTQTHALWWFQW